MIRVAAAVITNREGQILVARRRKGKPQEGLWEFPGGKLEEEESVPACLQRELMEEMGIEITPYAYFGVNEHRYGDAHIQLIAWRAEYRGGEILLSDHDEYRWVSSSQLEGFSFAPADIPFVERLMREAR